MLSETKLIRFVILFIKPVYRSYSMEGGSQEAEGHKSMGGGRL